jgi:hypothetical protein
MRDHLLQSLLREWEPIEMLTQDRDDATAVAILFFSWRSDLKHTGFGRPGQVQSWREVHGISISKNQENISSDEAEVRWKCWITLASNDVR